MRQVRGLVPGMEATEQIESNPSAKGLWEQLSKAGGNSSEGILRVLNQESQAYDRLAQIMALQYPEFDAAAKTFSAELNQSQNPLFAESLPACLKARQREFRVWSGNSKEAVRDFARMTCREPSSMNLDVFSVKL